MSIYFKNKMYTEHKFSLESDFEGFMFENSELFFGKNAVLLDVKKKIDSGDLGRAIPDGFLFDFSDPDDPRFYLIEIELQSHDFYKHIFPQITKFFAFLRGNTSQQAKLIDALYRVIESVDEYKQKIKEMIKGKELFKFLKDVIESSGDILLVIDGKKPEIEEIMITYTDTWGKYVKLVVSRIFKNEFDSIVFCEPDFDLVKAIGDEDESEDDSMDSPKSYNEAFHLSYSNDTVVHIFSSIKEKFSDVDFNPQRNYISMMNGSNFAYMTIRKKLVRIVVLVPVEASRKIIKSYVLKEPSEGVQRFYNAKCTEIKIDSVENIKEVIKLLEIAKGYEKKRLR